MKTIATPDEYIHVYNRGVLKQKIFRDNRDYARFLFLILFCQSSSVSFFNLKRPVDSFVRHSMFNISSEVVNSILKKRDVRLIAFTLRPNHFHLIVQEINDGGLAKYLQRIGNAFTKYINTRYQTSGHLFQGSYQSVLISDNDQLLYTSAYIHKHTNIHDRWSSNQDFVKKNRWPGLLDPSLVLEQFSDGKEYKKWLEQNPAKETPEDDGVRHPMSNID